MTINLEHFAQFLPYVQQLLGSECTFGISDREKYVAYLPGKELALPIKPGDPIKAGSLASKVITGGLQESSFIGEEVYGSPYMGIGIPVKDNNGQVIGSLLMGMPVTVAEDANMLVEQVNDDLNTIHSEITGIINTIKEHAKTIDNLYDRAESLKLRMNITPAFDVAKGTHLENRVLVLSLLRKKIEDMLPREKYR